MIFEFYRYCSTGNTFFICSLDDYPLDPVTRPDIVVQLCKKYEGFHTDGFVFLMSHKSTEYIWDFYNQDGSSAEMCGNAVRAVACHLNHHFKIKQTKLTTVQGLVELGLSHQNSPSFYYGQWKLTQDCLWEQECHIQNYFLEYDYINSGVPHAVVEMPPSLEIASTLRNIKSHHPQGMNITFVEQLSPGEIEAVTFERGIEDFTLSCGTGAVAAAIWSKELNPELKRHKITMPGGDLQIKFLEDHQVRLEGPCEFHFKIQVDL